MTKIGNAAVGAIAGSSGDAGVEYRRAVGAYAASCGLASIPLLGFGVGPAEAHVAAVRLETDDPIDDIRIEFNSRWVSFVQAKVTLKKGKPLNTAVRQWRDAATAGIDPDVQRLVIVAGTLNGPMRTLQTALDLFEGDAVPSLTKEQAKEIHYLEGLLVGLDDEQITLVKRCGVIHELPVLEESHSGAREGALMLGQILSPGSDATDAWRDLVSLAGRAARRRGGHTIQGWLDALRGRGYAIDDTGDTRASELERLHQALFRHREAVRRPASVIDLRWLGAEIPPIPIEEIDAEVKVNVDVDNDRSSEDLVWAFLRRGRMVLTGLPGSGKSAALRQVAMQLAVLQPDSIPLVVQLKSVDLADGSRGFGEKLIQVALRELAPRDAALLKEEIERRLASSGVTLILDGLDETYERRATVIQELDSFLAGVSPDVDVLLSTRDVAYGHAATLNWPSLRLLAPTKIDRTIDSILRAAFDATPQDRRVDRNIGEFTEPRRSWIMAAIRRDETLVETPLLPVLLCLLAAERATASLPSSRAAILEAVVRGVIDRREKFRPASLKFGPLAESEAALAALDSFAVEGRHILTHGGVCSLRSLVDAVARELRQKWTLSEGHSQIAGRAVVHFWDETGIFVISGVEESVSPRVMLFAEVGDALRTVDGDGGEIEAWVSQRLAARNIEPVVLASGLSPLAAKSLAQIATTAEDRELLHATLRAVREGAVVTIEDLLLVASALLRDSGHGDWESWQSWLSVLRLGERLVSPDVLRDALAAFNSDYQVVGQALLALRSESPEALRSDPRPLLAAMAIKSIGHLESREPKTQDTWRRVDGSLTEAILRSADLLVGHNLDADQLALEHLGHGPAGLQKDLGELLSRNGYATQVAESYAATAKALGSFQKQLDRWQRDTPTMLLSEWAAWPSAALEYGQEARLDELADLVATMNLNSIDVWGDRDGEWWPALVNVVTTLGGFDREVVAAEAQVAIDRIGATTDAAFYSLFDLATERELSAWDSIDDVEGTVEFLVGLLFERLGVAQVASACLWGEQALADVVVPKLLDAIPRLASSDRHQRAAAWLLWSIGGPQVTKSWADDSSPVLRGVAARSCDGDTDGVISADLQRFLNDDDGHVREKALQRLAETDAKDRLVALEAAAAGPDPGWLCFSCGTTNAAGATGCAKDGCFRAGARPSEVAAKLLTGLKVEDGG